MKIEAFALTNFGRTLKQRKLTKANGSKRKGEAGGEVDGLYTYAPSNNVLPVSWRNSVGGWRVPYRYEIYAENVSYLDLKRTDNCNLVFSLQFSTLPSLVFSLTIYACFRIYTNVAAIFATSGFIGRAPRRSAINYKTDLSRLPRDAFFQPAGGD